MKEQLKRALLVYVTMVEGLMVSKIRFSWKGKNGLHANLGLLWTLVLVAYFVGFSIFFWYENDFI